MKRLIELTLLLPLLWAAGCQKETSTPGDKTSGEVGEATVKIHASLASPNNSTKAVILEDNIPDGFSYGLFVCTNNTQDQKHKLNSWNLKATYKAGSDETDGKWTYQYIDNLNLGTLTTSSYENITITDREDHKPADLYAYAPYISGAFSTDPTRIPFTIENNIINQADLMYAEENSDPQKNKGLDPLSEDELEADFTFKHALTLLAFEFRIKNHVSNTNTSNYILRSISVKNTKKGTEGCKAKLYNQGLYNAVENKFSFTVNNEVETIEVNQSELLISHKDNGPDLTAYMLLVPTDVNDDELEFTFKLSAENSVPLPPFVLKKEYLKHSDDETTYGFKGGYKYTFKFTLDDFLYLNGTIIDEWAEEEEELTPIEI